MAGRHVSRETLSIEEQMGLLEEGCQRLGIELTPNQRQGFEIYLIQLLLWNRRINLISRNDEGRVVTHHFLDSLSVLPYLHLPPGARVIDVGTGAGFPGLPIKICQPWIYLTLLDSIRKKTLFLRKVVDMLGLDGVEVICGRAERVASLSPDRLRYGLVLTRAVGKLDYLAEICLPLLREGGCLVVFKGEDVEEELGGTSSAIEDCGGSIAKRVDVVSPFGGKRRVFVFIERRVGDVGGYS